MNECLSLPGITIVAYITRDCLPDDVVYRAVAGIPVTLAQAPVSISLKGQAVCEVERDFNNNTYIEKAKLTFYSLTEIPTELNLAYAIRTVDGDYYVIGAKERPYPTVKVTRTTGQPDGDASVRKYEVSFTARKALAALST